MKKGFTLIELLAVIVILAVIALIATPIVLSIINDTKESAVIRSAEMYVGAVENKIMQENMKLGGKLNPKECIINSDGNVTCDGTDLEIEVNGDKPDSGLITYDRGRVTGIELTFGDRKVITDINGELVLSDIHKLPPGLYDENDNLLISWSQLTSMDYQTVTYTIFEYDEFGSGTEVKVNSSILKLDEDGVFSIPYDELEDNSPSCEYLEGKLVLDETVKALGTSSYFRCENLISLVIPESVTSIEEGLFFESNLKNVIIPKSVTKIGPSTFYSAALTNITIPNSVTSIGNEAFISNGLLSVTIGKSVTSIGEYAFAFNQLTSVIIPNGITKIEGFTFYDNKLTSVVIRNSVTSIAFAAFSENKLTSITIPDDVTIIEANAFNQNQLTSIIIPSSVTYIGEGAFESNELTSVIIKGKSSIDDFAYFGDGAFGWASGYSDANITWEP